MKDICGAVPEFVREDLLHDLDGLGDFLLLLGNAIDARTSFELENLNLGSSDGDFLRRDHCHATLRKNSGWSEGHWVCRSCAGVDLCLCCMESYPAERELWVHDFERCEGYEFLEVPGDGSKKFGSGTVNLQGETKLEWLDRLLKECNED